MGEGTGLGDGSGGRGWGTRVGRRGEGEWEGGNYYCTHHLMVMTMTTTAKATATIAPADSPATMATGGPVAKASMPSVTTKLMEGFVGTSEVVGNFSYPGEEEEEGEGEGEGEGNEATKDVLRFAALGVRLLVEM